MPGGGEVFPHFNRCVCFVVDLVLLLHAKTAVVGLLLLCRLSLTMYVYTLSGNM